MFFSEKKIRVSYSCFIIWFHLKPFFFKGNTHLLLYFSIMCVEVTGRILDRCSTRSKLLSSISSLRVIYYICYLPQIKAENNSPVRDISRFFCRWFITLINVCSLQSFHAEDVLWVLPLTAVIVVCNYLHFPHRWSVTATASKQSSTILSSLKTVMAQDWTASHFVSIRKKKSLMTAKIKCVLLKLLPYNMWNGECWLLLWCLNKINVWY